MTEEDRPDYLSDALNGLTHQEFYNKLLDIARKVLRKGPSGPTIDEVALIGESLIPVLNKLQKEPVNDRGHLFALITRKMRHVLIDYYARKKQAAKHGGGDRGITYKDEQGAGRWTGRPEDYLALDEALDRLDKINPDACRVTEFRFFYNYTYDEIADIMGTSYDKVRRLWGQAKIVLSKELTSYSAK